MDYSIGYWTSNISFATFKKEFFGTLETSEPFTKKEYFIIIMGHSGIL